MFANTISAIGAFPVFFPNNFQRLQGIMHRLF